jgi:NitT/TauT family transport system permease protein
MKLLNPRAPISFHVYNAAVLLCVLLFVTCWQWSSRGFAESGKSVLLPSPTRVYDSALELFGRGKNVDLQIAQLHDGWTGTPAELAARENRIREQARSGLTLLLSDLSVSFVRVTTAFLLAAAIAVPLGVLMGSLRIVEAFCQPMVEFVRYVPVPALVPLLIVFFGVDELPKIMLIFIGTFFQLVLMVQDEVKRVPQSMLRAAYTLGAKPSDVIGRVMLPHALPGIFDALRLCNGWAWTWLIVAELVAADSGMGFRIVKFQRYLRTDRIFLYLIVLGIVGLLIDFLFRMMNRRLFRWNNTVRG